MLGLMAFGMMQVVDSLSLLAIRYLSPGLKLMLWPSGSPRAEVFSMMEKGYCAEIPGA